MSTALRKIFVRRHNLGYSLNVINLLLAIYNVKFHGSVTVNSAVNSSLKRQQFEIPFQNNADIIFLINIFNEK